MHTRSRAAATTALLLTASVTGLAATGSAADASGSHPATAGRAAPTLTVTITTHKTANVLSVDTLRPGKTMFKVVRKGAGGLIQVLRLKPGYTIGDAASDFALAFPDGNTPPDVHAVRRVDRNVVFYGGMPTPKPGASPNKWGVDIDHHGTYYVVNLDRNNLATFAAKGKHQRRSLPAKDGWVNMATASDGVTNIFKAPKTDPHKGWMKTTNNAKEPHFVVMDRVKKSTTKQDVEDFLTGHAPPPFTNPPTEIDTGVVSPDRTIVWKYGTTKGRYLTWCFWPSKIDGTPHAFMGMFKLLDLT
jgi:hypothetical protein